MQKGEGEGSQDGDRETGPGFPGRSCCSCWPLRAHGEIREPFIISAEILSFWGLRLLLSTMKLILSSMKDI